jgi:hypothetical protein
VRPAITEEAQPDSEEEAVHQDLWHDLQELLCERDSLWHQAETATRAKIEATRHEYGRSKNQSPRGSRFTRPRWSPRDQVRDDQRFLIDWAAAKLES